jgi:hypothetical protein
MKIRVLMITYNRPAYTAMALAWLCDTLPDDARLTVWDNGSGQEMRDVLKKFEGHRLVERIVYNRTNDKLRAPTNWFWQSVGEAEFVSKVDDDGLMPDRWTEILEQAHRDIPQAGVLGTWRFPDEDFVADLAIKKIQTFGAHKILRNCWVEGSGYLMKRTVIERVGFIRENESFTSYCIRAAAAGFVNGWYFPFLYQEHMDDPRAPHTGIHSEADFQKLRPLTANTFHINTRQDWIKLNKDFALNLQQASFDPADYSGLKFKVAQKVCGLFGKRYLPKA